MRPSPWGQLPKERAIKWIRNLQEGRHSLARKVFHGDKGELYQRYRDGMEDQLGALGLVLNCIVLWNTVYINAALERLRAAGYPVREEDVVRLHPFMRRHIAVQGDYSFLLPALAGRLRELRDPTEAPDEDEERTNLGFSCNDCRLVVDKRERGGSLPSSSQASVVDTSAETPPLNAKPAAPLLRREQYKAASGHAGWPVNPVAERA